MLTQTDLLFSALGDPKRRAIFQKLSQDGERTVHFLTEFANISQPAVSKHLAILKRAELISGRREGRETLYSVNKQGLSPLYDWIELYTKFWNSRFDALENLLERMDQ